MTRDDLNDTRIYAGKHLLNVIKYLYLLGWSFTPFNKLEKNKDYVLIHSTKKITQLGDYFSYSNHFYKEITLTDLFSIKPEEEMHRLNPDHPITRESLIRVIEPIIKTLNDIINDLKEKRK